jgi:hypothetical protein
MEDAIKTLGMIYNIVKDEWSVKLVQKEKRTQEEAFWQL